MPQVFISYAAPDADTATKLVQAFQQQGIDTWAEATHLQSHDDWNDTVKHALHQADACVLVLSGTTFKLPSVAREYQYFLKSNKPLYGAIVGEINKDEIPASVLLCKHVDLREDFAAGVKQLTDYINAAPQALTLALRAQSASPVSALKLTVIVNGDMQAVNAALVEFVQRLEGTGVQVADVHMTDSIDD